MNFVIFLEMDSGNSTPRSNNLVIPVAVAALIVLAVIGYYLYSNNASKSAETANTQTTTETANPTADITDGYKNGQYEATGNYVSPGGPREVTITITLADGKITDSSFTGSTNADPTSQRFQGEFSSGYKTMIVGKSLDEVDLTKVAGSSLTPKGFMDALSKIKTDAQS